MDFTLILYFFIADYKYLAIRDLGIRVHLYVLRYYSLDYLVMVNLPKLNV